MCLLSCPENFLLPSYSLLGNEFCHHNTCSSDTLVWQWPWMSRSSPPWVLRKQAVLKNSVEFTGKHLYHSLFFSLFFNKVAGQRPVTLLKQRLWYKCFSLNFEKILKTFLLKNTSGGILPKSPLSLKQFITWKELNIEQNSFWKWTFTNVTFRSAIWFGDVSNSLRSSSGYCNLENAMQVRFSSKISFLAGCFYNTSKTLWPTTTSCLVV